MSPDTIPRAIGKKVSVRNTFIHTKKYLEIFEIYLLTK